MGTVLFLAGLIVGLLSMYGYSRRSAAARQPAGDAAVLDAGAKGADTGMASDAASEPAPSGASGSVASGATPSQSAAPEAARDRLSRLRREVESQDDRIQHPNDLQAIPEFREARDLLSGNEVAAPELLEHLGSGGYVLPSMAACALPFRDDVTPEAALSATAHFGGYPLRFILDYLQTRPDAATLPLLLRHAREWWWDAQAPRQRLREYFAWAEQHAPGAASVNLDELDEDVLNEQKQTLSRFQLPLLQPYLASVDATLTQRREQRVLSGFGRVMQAQRKQVRFAHSDTQTQLDQLYERIAGEGAGSLLVSGEHGVGKSVLIDQLTERLYGEGWLVFEASAAEILAGQKYIGELEGRVREMLSVLNRRRAVWRVHDFYDLLHKGAHSQDPRGILDLVMPAIDRGELRIVGELGPRQLAQLLVARPVVKHHFEIYALPAPSAAQTDAMAEQWAHAAAEQYGREVADARTLAGAGQLASQYFPEQHEPGRLLRLLNETLKLATAQEPPRLPLDRDLLLQAIAARSGLPLDVIDDRQSLDLEQLRTFFRQRVIGQEEAVDCLVDRIAMLKAGLVDSGRPIGVFLFAGPTGTGKTELAKALGELLFGNSDRLLRLDMSEYQTEDAAWRLLGEGGGHDTVRSFTSRVREQPFSVVLLDEFEKAHPKVWDLFLQVFDDARLSDRSGNTVDFRHSIIVLTSNVGSTISRSAGPGFTTTAGGYSRGTVEKALNETFRREFLNRLDRIVLFKPLDRALMREILHKELHRALTRRGLRNRDWAVEWEPSAVEFLLDRGFTPDLGARPLRRAIEQFLLAPLARTIVEHRAPQGDQFLIVRSAGDRLEVEFIDPDGALSQPSAVPMQAEAGDDLRDLILTPTVQETSLARLQAGYERLHDIVTGASWTHARAQDYAAMAEADFWTSPSRWEVLDRIERRDRIESALDTAGRFAGRLARDGGSIEFIARQAQLLFLLETAIGAVQDGRPQDALLEITPGRNERSRDDARAHLWWQQLLTMYQAWAQRRNMRVEVLHQDPAQCRARLAISGFGALDLLASETGLHVLELEQDDGSTRRVTMQVVATPDVAGRARQFKGENAEELRVCRRYRDQPSPLVRDSVRGWRSGRFDRVLAGEFDVMPSGE